MFKPLYVYKIKSGPVNKRLRVKYRIPSALRNYTGYCGASLKFEPNWYISYIDSQGLVTFRHNVNYENKLDFTIEVK